MTTSTTGSNAPDLATRRRHRVRPSRRASRLEGRAADLSMVLLGLAAAGVLLLGSLTMEVRGQQVPGPQLFPLLAAGLLAVTSLALLVLVLRPSHQPEETDPNPDISRAMIEDLTELTEHGPRAFVEQVRHPQGSTTVSLEDLDGAVAGPVDSAGRARGSVAQDDAAGTPEPSYPLDWRTVLLTVGALVVFIVALEPLGWILSAAALFWIVARAFGSARPLTDLGIALLFASLIQLVFTAGLGLSLPAGVVGGLF